MPLVIPLSEPPALNAGETALWQRDLSPDYPAPTWSLNYYLVGPTRINIASAANGTRHEMSVNAATTANPFGAGSPPVPHWATPGSAGACCVRRPAPS